MSLRESRNHGSDLVDTDKRGPCTGKLREWEVYLPNDDLLRHGNSKDGIRDDAYDDATAAGGRD